MKWISAKVTQISPLTNTIIQVELEPHEYVFYRAGQYLLLKAGAHQAYFSIANAPLGTHRYELHIRHEKKNIFSQELLNHFQSGGDIEFNLPMGQAHVGHLQSSRPIIFIAGGTGFAPIKAIIEQLLYTDDPRTFECYWGAKEQSDLYWRSKLLDWRQHVKSFTHLALFEGKKSYFMIDSIYERHHEQIKDMQFLICGPFEMVYACRDKLVELGVLPTYIYSDAFEFENKEKL
jgi:CDP-4-dehydro-6-deoxyglucose reductase